MVRQRSFIPVVLLGTLLRTATPVWAEESWGVSVGETTFLFAGDVLAQNGLSVVPVGAAETPRDGEVRSASFLIEKSSTLQVAEAGRGLRSGYLAHAGGLEFQTKRNLQRVWRLGILIEETAAGLQLVGVDADDPERRVLISESLDIAFDPVGGVLLITADAVRLTPWFAASLGRPRAARQLIGSMTVRARLKRFDGNELMAIDPVLTQSTGGVAAGAIGPDIIVGVLQSINSYGAENGISAFSVGTTSCNAGDQPANWIAETNEHPVIGQNLYRLKNSRLEQIGMSWLKHGFATVAGNACGFGCQEPPGGTKQLGIGCSDPYSANLNGTQDNLGPRSAVNPFTGFFPCLELGCRDSRPEFNGGLSAIIPRRIQVKNEDLDATLNPGAIYFVESAYVSADDALAGNGANNNSYRRAVPQVPTGCRRAGEFGNLSADEFCLIPGSELTRQEQPGIRAWQDTDSTVLESDVQIPGEGLFVVASKSIVLGESLWRYEYAIQNINSDRAAGSFTVTLPLGAPVGNIGFHDVDHHSGEPYDVTDWSATVTNGLATSWITWTTTPHDVNPDANALRWGTMYNFWFETSVGPAASLTTLGLFKPGSPSDMRALTIGPSLDLIDCNNNGLPDACDISCDAAECELPCGMIADCDVNNIPDDCQPDCNMNGLADECDLLAGTPDCNGNLTPDDCEPDCDGDGLPDDCDTFDDCDSDGIEDCRDLCPCTSPPASCVCPAVGRCCFPSIGTCLNNFPRAECIAVDGIPDCLEAPCTDGCPDGQLGDFDVDGDWDMMDLRHLFLCFSGPTTGAGFIAPTPECLLRFDADADGDIELDDYFNGFLWTVSGP